MYCYADIEGVIFRYRFYPLADDILPDLSLAAFEQKIRVTEFSISDLATEQNVSQLMRSAYNMYTKGTRNFVILCNDTHIDWILRKVSG